jgi:hypothetical protein
MPCGESDVKTRGDFLCSRPIGAVTSSRRLAPVRAPVSAIFSVWEEREGFEPSIQLLGRITV